MAKKKKRKKIVPEKHNANVWDFLIRFIDQTYSLINSGNIIGALFLGVIVWFLIITIRIPQQDIGQITNMMFKILMHAGSAVYFLGAALSVSISANLFMYKSYKKEIHRLTDLRKKLIHGIKTKELKAIENHVSCKTKI